MPSSPAFVRRITAELEPHLAGDHLLAGAEVICGPSPYLLYLFAAVAEVALAAIQDNVGTRLPPASLPHHHAYFVISEALVVLPRVVLPLAALYFHRPALVAVTRQQVMCCELTRFRKRLVRVNTAPLDAAIITRYRSTRRKTAVTLELPMAGKKFRLHGFKDKRRDLNRVLATAAALGVTASQPAAMYEARAALAD